MESVKNSPWILDVFPNDSEGKNASQAAKEIYAVYDDKFFCTEVITSYGL